MALLTICIPTYNRSKLLERCLRAFETQILEHDDVFLHVSDNCSTDDTEEIVRRMQVRCKNKISYKRQSSNLGFDGNFSDAINTVECKYVAIFGDDDVPAPNYIHRILSVIRENPEVALVNFNMYLVEGSSYFGTRDPLMLYGNGRHYPTGGAFLLEHHIIPSQISSNVFLRDMFLDKIKNICFDEYPGYGWYMALLRGAIRRPCVYLDDPLVWADKSSSKSWLCMAPLYYIVGLGHVFKDLEEFQSGLFAKWRDVLEKTWMADFCLGILNANRDLYREKLPLLEQYATSDEFRKQVKEAVTDSAFRIRLRKIGRRIKRRIFT